MQAISAWTPDMGDSACSIEEEASQDRGKSVEAPAGREQLQSIDFVSFIEVLTVHLTLSMIDSIKSMLSRFRKKDLKWDRRSLGLKQDIRPPFDL
jgi:hypothetical protein